MTKIALQHLTRVVARDKDTWFSIHHKVIFTDGRVPSYPGNAHQTMRTALLDAMYWAHKGHDVYFANGAYLNAGEHKQGRPYPDCIRQRANLTACKCLYMDIDVKEGAFGSTGEAVQAMMLFVHKAKIPAPTIMVLSGSGGFHAYWTMSELFAPSEFYKMSAQLTRAAVDHGIHFDQQCTNDPTRLLRVADTWNFKAGPGIDGTKVELKWDSADHGMAADVDISAMRAALDRFPAVTPQSKRNPRTRLLKGSSTLTTIWRSLSRNTQRTISTWRRRIARSLGIRLRTAARPIASRSGMTLLRSLAMSAIQKELRTDCPEGIPNIPPTRLIENLQLLNKQDRYVRSARLCAPHFSIMASSSARPARTAHSAPPR